MKNPPSKNRTEALRKAQAVRMLLMDVDGVLTDGGIIHGSGGQEFKRFDVQDGMGITLARAGGIRVGIITGRRSEAVVRRSGELHMDVLVQDAHDKQQAFGDVRARYELEDRAVCYVGDDVLDIPLLRRVGFAVAVANAREEVKETADYVTAASGGRGAIREVVELILKSQGRWEGALESTVPGFAPISTEEG